MRFGRRDLGPAVGEEEAEEPLPLGFSWAVRERRWYVRAVTVRGVGAGGLWHVSRASPRVHALPLRISTRPGYLETADSAVPMGPGPRVL